MAIWAFLADPKDYGWDELVDERRAAWTGIGNATAQKNLRSACIGDRVLLYHTSPDKALVATARVASDPYPDPDHEKRVVVDVEPVEVLARPLPLSELKADPVLAEMSFVRMPRVAVQPVTGAEWDRVMELSGTDPGSAADVDAAQAGGP